MVRSLIGSRLKSLRCRVGASRLSEQHSINFWDALIIEAALRAGATELVTKDLPNGRRFGELAVRNPFCTR